MSNVEPNEEDMPVEVETLSPECQQALILLNSLPDMWDGMSGTWLGKDYSGLLAIFDIYEIDDRKEVFELYKAAEDELRKYYTQEKKARESSRSK